MQTIYVYAASSGGSFKKADLEAVSYAKAMADMAGTSVTAITIGADAPEVLYTYGANKVVQLTDDLLNEFDPSVYAKAIAQAYEGGILVLAGSNDGATIAPELVVKKEAALITNVLEAPTQVAPFQVKRKAFSGKGIETVEATEGNIVITVSPNAFGVAENIVDGSTESKTVTLDAGDKKLKTIKVETPDGNKLDLKEAERVVSAGRGLKGAENWGLIEELANVLGAATACSKPVSDVGWRPHSEHVGQTGKAISPKLYIAIGISGAIQHLAGVSSSDTIVVINTDPEAPFFKSADYGIVGDAFEVVPKLVAALK